jgi:hypothetical protein
VEQSTITGNTSEHAGRAGGLGGGIVNDGFLTLVNSSVTRNAAAFSAGALLNDGTAMLEGDFISRNAQTFATPHVSVDDSVGGIASFGRLNIHDSVISKNTGGAGGLFLFAFGVDILISQCVIDANTALPGGFGSGGIDCTAEFGHIRIENSLIKDNHSASGAGGMGGFGVRGSVDVIASTITGNIGATGGISTSAGGQIVDSTISHNTGDFAGGINCAFAPLQVVRSTISGNVADAHHAYAAGGISTEGPLTIDNSTISGNRVLAHNMKGNSGGAGGGMLVLNSPLIGGPTSIDHSTIAFNSVLDAPQSNLTFAGGINGFTYTYNGYQYPADVQVRNTIIAKNVFNLSDPDVTGTFLSAGHNLIGVLGSTATGFVASDLSGTATFPLDPRLLPLANNGGPTKTHALRPNSPAVNAGDNANAPPTDQRGFARIDGDGIIDIGAYELQHGASSKQESASPIAVAPSGLPSATIGGLAVNLQPSSTAAIPVNVGAGPPLVAPGVSIQQQTAPHAITNDHPTSFVGDGLVLFGGQAEPTDDPFLALNRPVTQAGL